MQFGFMSLGAGEILVIVLIVLLLFGAKRIPDLAKALGRAKYEFQKAKKDLENESEELIKTAEKNAELQEEQKKSVAAEESETGKES